MTKLSLGQAAKAAKFSKSTLQRMLQDGRVSGHQREDSVWEIDASEVARIAMSKDRPQRGRRVPAEEPAPAPQAEAIEAAVLKAELQGVRDRLADAIARAEAAEAREAAERDRVDRLTRLIEDRRPTAPRGFWSRITGNSG